MKKFFVIFLICALTLPSLSACEGGSPAAPSSVEVLQPEPAVSPDVTPEEAPVPTAEPTPQDREEQQITALLQSMTLEEKVSQLFMLRFDYFFTAPTEEVKAFAEHNRAGGYVLFKSNITTVNGTRALVDCMAENSALPPFIATDEEGGDISRLYSAGLPGYEEQPAAAEIGASGNTAYAYETAGNIGKALSSIGVNLNFAPVADVLTNPGNTVIGTRSFGSDPALVSDMMAAFIQGLHGEGIMAAPKHFPGHGGTGGDSHEGAVTIDADAAQLNRVEYEPFRRAAQEGAEFILTGHILAPNADSSGLPASLSPYFLTDVLRGELGYDGLIITDAMDMGAIIDHYSSDEAAVLALTAGADIILMPQDYEKARNGVLAAISDGTLTEKRIDESVTRVLLTKIRAELITVGQ